MKFILLVEEVVKGTKAYKAKYAHNNKIARLKKLGKFKKPKRCPKCKGPGPFEFAHTNYNNGKGRWLCTSCHRKENAKMAKKRGAKGVYNPTGKYPKKY